MGTSQEAVKRQIHRKPVGAATLDKGIIADRNVNLGQQKPIHTNENSLANQFDKLVVSDHSEPPPSYFPPISLQTSFANNLPNDPGYSGPVSTSAIQTQTPIYDDSLTLSAVSPLPSTGTSSTSGSVSSPSSALSTVSSNLQKGLREARHFAGGLLSHPYESTKHFSILRHSFGLVFYQGPATSLAISIFADAPLPPDRTLWLQSKGWSGNAGMRARAFIGRNGYWLDVTPATQALPQQLDPDDERAWQRDIAKFKKKADRHVRDKHILRETIIVRIPVEAGDGYFRLVLCTGPKKKVLCPSPVFRVLSTSTSPSSLKGASLTQLPLELGAMILSSALKTTVGNTVAPITSVVQDRVQAYMPSSTIQTAATTAYDASGAADKIDSTLQDANTRYDALRDSRFSHLEGVETTPDSGPRPPYPFHFKASVDMVHGEDTNMFGMPSLRLATVSEAVSHRLDGHYFAWAHIYHEKDDRTMQEATSPWYQAVISALPASPSELARIKVTHTGHKSVILTLLDDSQDVSFGGLRFDIRVMGFIRPSVKITAGEAASMNVNAEVDSDNAMVAAMNDIAITQASLDRPAWGPESILDRSEGGVDGGLDVKTRYAQSRLAVQRQIDRIPFRKVGLRVGVDNMRDKAIGAGGIYVTR